MKKYFTVGEAAKAAGITSETLRHYDRIGLIKPSKKDDATSYRYYTEQDIVRINTVRALQQMDLSLLKIKEMLECNDLERIIHFLTEAEKKVNEKISWLEYGKEKIKLAKSDYENKLCGQRHAEGIYIQYFSERIIMLSDTLETPTLDNLWNYLHHFYQKIEPARKERFTFEDLAGIYTEKDVSRLFAVCIRYEKIDGLKVLPKGNYLCMDCTEENKESGLHELRRVAQEEYHVCPSFTIQQIVISGILQWDYQAQVFLGE